MKNPIAELSFAKARRTLNIPSNLTMLLAKTSPRMQGLVTALCWQNGYDLNAAQSPLRLESASQGQYSIPLVIERRGTNLVAVAQMVQVDKEGSTWQKLPEIVFSTKGGRWVPISFQGSPTSFERLTTLLQQRKVAAFAEEWADELRKGTWGRK